YDEHRAYYDAEVRLKGSERGRYSDTRVSFHVEFRADDLFRGVHPVMLIDRSGAGDTTSNKQLEIVIRHMLLRAGHIPGTYPDLCRVIAPRSLHTGPSIFSPRQEDEFIQTAYPAGGSGTLYELELIYYPTTANAYGYKNPSPDSVVGTDISDLGPDKEIYRYNFIIKNHRDADDYSRFMTFAQSLSLTGAALDAASRQTMDVDEWLRAWALVTLCGVGDSYTFGNNHNLLIYLRPQDQKILAFPVDMDFSFTRAYNDVLVGNSPAGVNLSKVINLPSNLRVFYGHILDIIGSCYNPAYITRWTDHYDNFCPGQNYSAIPAYIQSRGDFAKTTINSAGGNAAFALSGSSVIYQASNVVTLSGTAPVQVRTIKVNGNEYPVTWNSLSSWTIRLAAASPASRFNLVGYDVNGNPMTNYALGVTANITNPMDSPQGSIVINEIMYNPAVSNASYVELFNRSTNTTFDLTGYRFHGLGYDFPVGTLLYPRAYLVLTKSITAFTNAYGTNITPFAEFPGVLDTDGDNGTSLQLIDPAQDNSRPNNWGAGGTWTFFSLAAKPGNAILKIYPPRPGDIYLDDIMIVPGAVAGVGSNFVRNGDFETPIDTNTWASKGTAASTSTNSSLYAHSGASSLHLVFNDAGSSLVYFYQNISNIAIGVTNTLSFWYLPTTNLTNIL
ncbi:MAG: lamin tail domain-containing protein, partial [Verrucomicrobia bacterium]|nr:lamin tail domain-containing protein [Verrucomicrobiota bacterium]